MSTLRELREENKKSRAEVAAALGVANRTLSHYECGTRFIDIRQVLILANLYECRQGQPRICGIRMHRYGIYGQRLLYLRNRGIDGLHYRFEREIIRELSRNRRLPPGRH